MLDSEVTAWRFIRMETMIATHAEEEDGTSKSFEFSNAQLYQVHCDKVQ